jgi:tetratricopeptide (TPR) repeat protein
VLIIDNAKHHHARLRRDWRQMQEPDLSLAFLPPYSPELNPIERVWKLVRRLCLHNRYFPELALVMGAVEGQFAQWASGSSALTRLCAVGQHAHLLITLFQRALALEPQSAEARTWYGFFLWARLRHEQALAELRKAAELDPFRSQTIWFLSWALLSLGRCDEVFDLARKLLAMDPVFWGSHHLSGVAKWLKGMQAEAIQDLEKAAALERGPVGLGVLCSFYASAGRSSEAQQVLEQLQQMAQQRYVPPVWLAWAYDGVGAKDQARACIQRAIEEHDLALVHLRGWRGWFPGLLEDCLPLLDKAGV